MRRRSRTCCISPGAGRASLEFDPPEVEDEEVTILMYTSDDGHAEGRPAHVQRLYAYVRNVDLPTGTPAARRCCACPLYHIAGATNVMTTCHGAAPRAPPAVRRHALARNGGSRTHHARLPGATMVKQLMIIPISALRPVEFAEPVLRRRAMPFPVIRRAIELFPQDLGFVNASARPRDVDAHRTRAGRSTGWRGRRRSRDQVEAPQDDRPPLPDVALKSSTTTVSRLDGEVGSCGCGRGV